MEHFLPQLPSEHSTESRGAPEDITENIKEETCDYGLASDLQRRLFLASNQSDSTLLITGETGTGKSRLACLSHTEHPVRSGGRFVKVNLATLSESLLESELFGHEKGAFTGADFKRAGRVELASGGTLFLDEIGELPLKLQAKLLDLIQYKTFVPVGGNRELSVNTRIVAATNQNLYDLAKRGLFRQDLLHRLAVFEIELLPLRKRTQSLGDLAKETLHRMTVQRGLPAGSFSDAALDAIEKYDWPGNHRELENTMEYALALYRGPSIDLGDLPQKLQECYHRIQSTPQTIRRDQQQSFLFMNSTSPLGEGPLITPATNESTFLLNYHQAKERFERDFISKALKLCGYQINATSRLTGLNKVSLTEKIKRYEINWKDWKEPGTRRERQLQH